MTVIVVILSSRLPTAVMARDTYNAGCAGEGHLFSFTHVALYI